MFVYEKKRRDLVKAYYFGLRDYLAQENNYLKKIVKDIEKLYGPTLLISGDDIRKILISENIL